ncbi:MAG: hypothetical protein AMK69_10690 [Nitrospira bacterium SG8_3]|nr:MAG: hypothetical protein AMK69_10690 [Nitrospira bacterium SG8_3]
MSSLNYKKGAHIGHSLPLHLQMSDGRIISACASPLEQDISMKNSSGEQKSPRMAKVRDPANRRNTCAEPGNGEEAMTGEAG